MAALYPALARALAHCMFGAARRFGPPPRPVFEMPLLGHCASSRAPHEGLTGSATTATLQDSGMVVEHGWARWSVSSYRHHGDLEVHEYTTHRLDSAQGMREHYRLAGERPWVSRIEITEFATAVLRRPISAAQLPGPGRLAAADHASPYAVQVCRFFAVEQGPQDLPTVDAVREHLAWLRDPDTVRIWGVHLAPGHPDGWAKHDRRP